MTENSEDRLIKTLVILLIVLFVGVPVAMFLAMGLSGSFGDSDNHFGMMGSWGGWGFMVIPAAIVVLIVIVLIYAISDHPHQQATPVPVYPQAYQYYQASQPKSEAMAILDRRLALGEISVDEYNKLRNELTKH